MRMIEKEECRVSVDDDSVHAGDEGQYHDHALAYHHGFRSWSGSKSMSRPIAANCKSNHLLFTVLRKTL